jgi:alkylation response protein AidB-like acyl-CoA dehydrogenase
MEKNDAERRMLAESVASFSKQNDGVARSRRFKDAGAGFDRDVWRQYSELGWLGVLVPEGSGGLGLDVPELAIVVEGLGESCAPEPLAASGFAQSVIAGAKNSKLGEQMLAGSAEGRLLVGVAWQEQWNTPDPAVVNAAVSEAGGSHRISGTKQLVVPADADAFIISARAQNGIGLYRVARDRDGVILDRKEQVDGSGVLNLRLNGVEMNEADILAPPGTGLPILERGLCVGGVLASAELFGLSSRLLEITLEYLGTRRQFGSPLSGFQVLRHRAVDLYIQQELMRAALAQAIRAFDHGEDLPSLQRAVSQAKARASDAALLTAREAVQLHGAIGYTEEAAVGVYLRRILTLSAWLGNAAWHRRRYMQLQKNGAGEEG